MAIVKEILAILLLAISSAGIAKQVHRFAGNQNTKGIVRLAPYFVGTKGCFILYNAKTNSIEKLFNEERCHERLSPCSTFKVALAVMAFDSNILKSKDTTFKWNGIRQDREVANRDHNAKSWMSDSIVWFSQRITSAMGKARIEKYLTDFNYGNKDISSGLTDAWLIPPNKTEGLKISAVEQLEFIKKLWRDQLPVTKRSMMLTREIMFLQKSPKGFSLSGKTGSNFYDKDKRFALGWFIGHLESLDKEYIAITNIRDIVAHEKGDFGGPRAKKITIDLLQDLGLW